MNYVAVIGLPPDVTPRHLTGTVGCNVASVAAAETAANSKTKDVGADGAVSESLHAFDVREPTIAAARASPSDSEAATSIDPIPV